MGGGRRFPGAFSLLLALAVGLFSTGCESRLLQGPVERRLRNRLSSLIGPARRYNVSISGTKDGDLVRGRIRRLAVSGEGVRIGGRLPIERMEMRLEHVRFAGSPLELLAIRQSDLRVEFSQESLNEYFTGQNPRDGLKARFGDGGVTLNLILRLFGVPTPIQTTGTLGIADGKRIVFQADTVEAPNAPLLGPSKQLVERQLNPLIDVESWGVPIRLTDVQVSDGRIVVLGCADLPPVARDRARRR